MTDTAEPPPKPLSVREQKMARTDRKRKRVTTNIKPMTDKQRAVWLSPEWKAKCVERLQRWREAHGGKVPTRAGIPDGWAGKPQRRKREEIIKVAEEKSVDVVAQLIEQGKLQKDAAGNEVLKWAIGVVLSKDENGKSCYPVRDQLAAAKLVADFTLSKPEAKTAVKLTSEDFLDALLAKEKAPE